MLTKCYIVTAESGCCIDENQTSWNVKVFLNEEDAKDYRFKCKSNLEILLKKHKREYQIPKNANPYDLNANYKDDTEYYIEECDCELNVIVS